MNDLRDLSDLDDATVTTLIDTAGTVADDPPSDALDGTTMVHLFGQPSTRTRVSAAAAITGLGGDRIELDRQSSQLSRGESIRDTGAVLSRYADGIMARVADDGVLRDLADSADVPVVNALTDRFHPLQALSDMYTIADHGLSPGDADIVFVGDGNNVAHSLLQAAGAVDGTVRVSCPQGHEPDRTIVDRARDRGADISIVHDPHQAVHGADIIYTDVWISMADDADRKDVERFRSYQVDGDLVAAADDPLVMHPLPAHRGEEITSAVLDSDRSIVYDQAENRMHMHTAVLLHLFDAIEG